MSVVQQRDLVERLARLEAKLDVIEAKIDALVEAFTKPDPEAKPDKPTKGKK